MPHVFKEMVNKKHKQMDVRLTSSAAGGVCDIKLLIHHKVQGKSQMTVTKAGRPGGSVGNLETF